MVRIPLIRRQPKEDLPHGKDGKSKDGSRPGSSLGKDRLAQPPAGGDSKKTSLPSDTVHYRGLQPQKSEAAVVKETSSPGAEPEKDRSAQPPWAGTGKKIPFPLKPPDEHEATQPAKTPVVEKAAITLTLPERPVEKQPAEAAFVARVIVPESRPEPPEVTQPSEAAVEETSVALEPPEKEAEKQPVEAAAISETPLPESPPEHHEAAQPSEAAVVEKTPSLKSLPQEEQPEHSAVAGVNLEGADGWAILQAMPDHIYRIGRDGISSVVSNDSRAGAGAVAHGAGVHEPHDGKTAADEKDKLWPLEKIILEELGRRSEQHIKKVLDTRQLQTIEFQVPGNKEVHHLEVRLTPFGQSEVLALVRDVTPQKQTHQALIESRNELENHLKNSNAEMMRVNKMLKAEVELREEQEEILKKNFRKLEGLLEDTIGAITLIVDRKDTHVADHQRRVSQLACAIGQEMNLRNDQMRAIRMAAQLHDLGKIFIPAEILRKPGKLTEAEMSVVRTHPDTDYQILKRIDFPISIADIVRQHHERMNGSGYPQGLKGDGILVEARILAVADVIEGMVFERPYRIAPGLEAALKELADQKGVLYDPSVVDCCLKLFAEEKFKFEPLPGQESPKSGSEQRHESLVSAGQSPDRRDL